MPGAASFSRNAPIETLALDLDDAAAWPRQRSMAIKDRRQTRGPWKAAKRFCEAIYTRRDEGFLQVPSK